MSVRGIIGNPMGMFDGWFGGDGKPRLEQSVTKGQMSPMMKAHVAKMEADRAQMAQSRIDTANALAASAKARPGIIAARVAKDAWNQPGRGPVLKPGPQATPQTVPAQTAPAAPTQGMLTPAHKSPTGYPSNLPAPAPLPEGRVPAHLSPTGYPTNIQQPGDTLGSGVLDWLSEVYGGNGATTFGGGERPTHYWK